MSYGTLKIMADRKVTSGPSRHFFIKHIHHDAPNHMRYFTILDSMKQMALKSILHYCHETEMQDLKYSVYNESKRIKNMVMSIEPFPLRSFNLGRFRNLVLCHRDVITKQLLFSLYYTDPIRWLIILIIVKILMLQQFFLI